MKLCEVFLDWFGVEEPDLNPSKHLWDKLQRRLQIRPDLKGHR